MSIENNRRDPQICTWPGYNFRQSITAGIRMKMSTDLKVSLKLKDLHFNKTSAFLGEILGGEIHTEPGLSVIRLANNNLLELLGPGASHPDAFFSHSNTLLSFRVGDLSAVINLAKEAGFIQLGNGELYADNYSFAHIRSEDGYVIGLFQDYK
jgi:hypothetical protein